MALKLDMGTSTSYGVTLFAAFKGDTKVALQVPLEIEETSAPTDYGVAWTWSPEVIDGFNTRTPVIGFTHENDASGFHTKAVMHFDLATWAKDESGTDAEGSFVLKLANGNSAQNRLYSFSVTLRSLANGFTVIEGQSIAPADNEPAISAAGAELFAFGVDVFDWGLATPPPAESLTLDAEGRITDYDFGTGPWSSLDGTCRVTITDGTRPASVIDGRAISLRSLLGAGFTVIEGQSKTPADNEPAINAASAEAYAVGVDMFSWTGATPTSESLTLDTEARIIDYGFGAGPWNFDGTCRVRVKNGSRPASHVTGHGISLRRL
jgi:hypothetical protein